MSATDSNQKPNPSAATTAPEKPSFSDRVSNGEVTFSKRSPMKAAIASQVIYATGAAIAVPVAKKLWDGGKRLASKLAQGSADSASKEVANEGVRAYSGGVGRGLTKLWR